MPKCGRISVEKGNRLSLEQKSHHTIHTQHTQNNSELDLEQNESYGISGAIPYKELFTEIGEKKQEACFGESRENIIKV